MAAIIRITVEDVDELIEQTYALIAIERATSPGGAFAFQIALDLVAGTYHYEYDDSTGGVNSWYRYRFEDSGSMLLSTYSNPFRPPGLSRLLIRQTALEEYEAGLVLLSAAGGTTTVLNVTDPRWKSSLWAADRGRGGAIYISTGAQAGSITRVVASSPSAGTITVNPALASPLDSGDQFEFYWLGDVYSWNLAINRGLNRYSYHERVPIVGDGTGEQLLDALQWLKSPRQVTGLWYRPGNETLDQPWGTYGRWWTVRQDRNQLFLVTKPAITTADTVYLEATRRADPLFTDGSTTPPHCNLDLVGAYAYDEVLASLIRPRLGGTNDQRAIHAQARQFHQRRLVSLQNLETPQPRRQQPQLQEPSNIQQPFKAR